MALDDDVLRWLYLRDSRVQQKPPESDDNSVEPDLVYDKYYLLALLFINLTLMLAITMIRCLRNRKQKNERPASLKCATGQHHSLAGTPSRTPRPSVTNFTATDTTGASGSRFPILKSQTNPSPSQVSARLSKMTLSKNSPHPIASAHTNTAVVSTNKHSCTSNTDTILVNDSANKSTKASDGDNHDSHLNKAANVITFTKSKTPSLQVNAKATRKVVQSLEQSANHAGKKGSLYAKGRHTGASLTQEVSTRAAPKVNECSVALTSKHEGDSDCRKFSTEDTGDAMPKLPALAIDTFREINCFGSVECKGSLSFSQTHLESTVKGYDSKSQSYCQADVIQNETKVNDQTNRGHDEISIEEDTNAVKLSLRDEHYIPIHRNSRRTTAAAYDRSCLQGEQHVKSDSITSDSIMSVNEAAVDLISGDLSSICRKFSNIQQDKSIDSMMCASTRCKGSKGHLAYTELHAVKTNNKSSQWTTNGAGIAERTVQTQRTRIHSRSPYEGSLSVSDDHSWSFTRRNPVFEDKYSSFMKVSSLSKRRSRRLRRTIQVEPRPSKKLIVPKTKSEKQRLYSEQWPDEMLHNKHKAPKLACLLLDPDDYLLENGKQIGAQKVYTKDGFKFIVPLTFVSYGSRKQRRRPLSEDPQNDVGFSFTNISADDASICEVDGVNSLDIHPMDELEDISNENGFERNLRESEVQISRNTSCSSSCLSWMHAVNTERDSGQVNSSRKHQLTGIMKTKQGGGRNFQHGAKQNETGPGECTTPLQMLKSTRRTNEIKEIATRSDVSVCVCCVNSQYINFKDATANVNEITRKGKRGKAVEPRLKHAAEVESMKNVSKWLSGVCSCRSHHSNSSINTSLGFNGQKNLARKQSTRTHYFPCEDNTSSDSGNYQHYHHRQEHKDNRQQNQRPLANKYITSDILQSHLARKRLALETSNTAGRKTDQGVSQSDSSLSMTFVPVSHSVAKFMKTRQSHLKANDDTHLQVERDYKYNSESINDLEKDSHDVSTKHYMCNNTRIYHHKDHHYLDVDDTKVDNEKLEKLQKLIAKLNAKRIHDHFQCERFHQSKRSRTESLGDVSLLGSLPVSYKSLGKLASASPAFAHMPLFKNRHNESVNIIVRLESSAQKNLIEKHTLGSLMGGVAASGDSSLPCDPDDCCSLGKNRNTFEPLVLDSTRRRILEQSNLFSETVNSPLNVFAGQKLSKEITQLNQKKHQTFSDVVDGDGHGQFHLRCALLSTDHHGLMSVKKFEGNIQEEDTVFMNDLSESKEPANVLEDLTNMDLSSDPTSLQLLMRRGHAHDKPTTLAMKVSASRDTDTMHQTNTECNPTLAMVHESSEANHEQLPIEQDDDSPARQKDTTLNVKLLPKYLHKENINSQHSHVSYGHNHQDLVKDCIPGTNMKAASRGRSHQHRAIDPVNCRLQKQKMTAQKDVRDITTQHRSQILGEGGVKSAASNHYIMNIMDRDKVAAESHLRTCTLDSTRVATNGHARNHDENSTQVSSVYATKDLTENVKSAIQFPGTDNGKQTNVVTNNKRSRLVKRTFNYKNKHLHQAAHPGVQYSEQNRDHGSLNKAKATNIENIPRAVINTMSRQTHPSGAAMKSLDNVPKEDSQRRHDGRKNHLNKHISHSSKLWHSNAVSDYKGFRNKRLIPYSDEPCLMRSGKDKADRTQKQLVNLSENTNPKELHRCSTFAGDVGDMYLSSEFKNNYSQKETYTEKQDDIVNVTYSKENSSSMPQTYISSDISPDSGNMSKQKHKCRPLYTAEDTIQKSNQMDQKRCTKGRLFPSNTGRFIQQRQKFNTLAKNILEPKARTENLNGQVDGTRECSPMQKQTLKKTKNKPESLNYETNKSIQFNEQVASPQFSQVTSKRISSKQKAGVNLLSQRMTPKNKNQTFTGRSVCGVPALSDNSLTFTADIIHNNDSALQSKVKNCMKEDVAIKKQSPKTKENENAQDSSLKLHSVTKYWQESNAKQVTRLQLSNHGDSLTSGGDDGLKPAQRCKFKKPSKLQDVLFKKMFKFCSGEDQKYTLEHLIEPTAALGTSQSTDNKTRSRKEFNGRVSSGKPNDTWITKPHFPEAVKVDKLGENRSGHDDQAGLHLQTLKTLKFVGEESTSEHVKKSHHDVDTSTPKHIQPSFDEEEGKEPGFETYADNILDETDDCHLPDQLPSKIGGSTDVSSAEISDVGSPKCYQQLASVDERPAAKHGDRKSICHVNVDELREKYLREMSQKGLCRKRTFRIKHEKGKEQDKDVVDSTMVDNKMRRTFSSDTTIIKSPVSLLSRNMATSSKGVGFYTSDICCSASQNYLKRKREDDKWEGPNAAKKSSSRSKKCLIRHSSSGKSISKEIPEKLFETGSDYGKLPSTTLKSNDVILNSNNDITVKQTAGESLTICSPKSRPDVSMKKPCGSREVSRLCSPTSQQRSDSRQVEPHRDSSGCRKLRGQFQISKSISPRSTSANIPIMDQSELMTQTLFPTPVNKAKHAGDTRVTSQTEDNHFSTQEKYSFLAGQQEPDHQRSAAKGPQKFGSRRSSQIPKMKRSETSSSRIHRSDTHSFSHTHPVPNENQKATPTNHSKSSSISRLETVSIKQERINETHSLCQSSNDTNKTVSGKGKQQKDVNTRSPGSSTDVVISWFEKENVHDTYQQDSDSDLILSVHNKPQSTVSRSPSNYTLTTVCGFQGETVRMPHTPHEKVGTAEINKHSDVEECAPSVKTNANELINSKIQANGAEATERVRQERFLKKNFTENIILENLNEELATNKEDSSKIPFWQKQPRSNSMKTAYEADKSVFGKRTTSFRETGSHEGLVGKSKSDWYSGKVENRVQEFDNKSIDVNKEQRETSSSRLQEGELKRPEDAHLAPPSRLRAMRGLAKNRKYVNSALMYTMKKQSTNLPYKKASDTKEQQSTLKNPVLSTNNSAVLNKGEFHPRHQIPSNTHLYNFEVRTSGSSSQNFEFQTTVHNNTTSSKAYETTNQNAIYFHSTHEPACKQMRMEITRSESSSGHSMEGYVRGSTDSFIEKSAAERSGMQWSIFPITVPFCAQTGDDNHMGRAPEFAQDAQNKQNEFEDNNHEEDDDQNRGINPENAPAGGSVCTASDSCKVSFDWYKPLATSTAQPSEHAQVLRIDHQGIGIFERPSAQSDNATVRSDHQHSSMFNALASNGEVNYGTSLLEETRSVGQESLFTLESRNQQGMVQTNNLNSMHNFRPGTMSDNWRTAVEQKREYRNSMTRDIAEPNIDASNDSLYQRPPHLFSIDMAQNPQNYLQHERMDQPANIAWVDLHPSQPPRGCHTSPRALLVSDNRRRCIPNFPQSCSRHHKRPESQYVHIPAKDASLSNLNALYEHLQHNYNQANAVYHSNWVLANHNNSLSDFNTIPGQFECCAHSKLNVGDLQRLLLQQRRSETYNQTRTHSHPCYENITSNGIFSVTPSDDDRGVHFRESIPINSVLEPVFSENRIPQGFVAQNHNFLLTSHNNPSISAHQQMPLNLSGAVPMTPAPYNNPANWPHLHQHLSIPSNHNHIAHVHPPTLHDLSFLENQQTNRWCSDPQSLFFQRRKEHHSDSSYQTARDYHNE